MTTQTTFQGAHEPTPWRFISFGVVAVHNISGDDWVEVWLAELLPFEEGEISEIDIEESQTLLDLHGKKRKATVNRKAMIRARWYPTTDGRQTAPNVKDGETVEIYQYAGVEPYYWKSHGRQPELRRLEHVTHAYSDLKEGREAFNTESSYGTTTSTREKFWRLWTATSDGESFSYQHFMDTMENFAAFHDSAGNIFAIDSVSRRVFMRNSAGTMLELAGGVINVKADVVNFDAHVNMRSLQMEKEIKALKITAECEDTPSPKPVSVAPIDFPGYFTVGK